MSLSEQQLIERFFVGLGAERADVILGIGDDAAIVRAAGDSQLALTTDALVEGVHFLPGTAARSLGHRALAVNLSDLAAMGAEPAWGLLSLVMPAAEESWLSGFAAGFGALARAHRVALVGGNLSRGPLSITVQLCGLVPPGQALRRGGARAGDALYVSGTLGDAACGLKLLRGALAPGGAQARAFLERRFEYPTPRVPLGQALRGLASACIDISDGLHTDLGRLARACGCAARVTSEDLPLSPALRATLGERAWEAALTGGEDYELCFAVPAQRAAELVPLAARCGEMLTRIGTLQPGSGIEVTRGGTVIQFSHSGFDHFGG